MTPDDIARRCETWAETPSQVVGWRWTDDRFFRRSEMVPRMVPPSEAKKTRRIVCVEPDGPRRTWVLYEGGRQVGHVRGRCAEAEAAERQGGAFIFGTNAAWVAEVTRHGPWTWEAANAGREVLS